MPSLLAPLLRGLGPDAGALRGGVDLLLLGRGRVALEGASGADVRLVLDRERAALLPAGGLGRRDALALRGVEARHQTRPFFTVFGVAFTFGVALTGSL